MLFTMTCACQYRMICSAVAVLAGTGAVSCAGSRLPACMANPRAHRVLGFCRPWAFFSGIGIFAHGAMRMLHVHVRCRGKSSACLLSKRPSSAREIDARGIDLRTSAPWISRAILTAPETSDKCASLVPRLIGNSWSAVASLYYSARPC